MKGAADSKNSSAAPKAMDVWLFQDTTMNENAQQYNMRNHEIEGRRCYYKKICKCVTMMVFGHSFSSSMQKIQTAETKHPLLIKCQSNGHN